MTEHVVISSSIQKSVNEIDRLVQEIGLESPEIGNKALHEAVQQRVTNSVVVTKQRIKRVRRSCPIDVFQQRQGTHNIILWFRKSKNDRRYEEADWIHKGLEAMGIIIDDWHKTWTVGESKVSIENTEPFLDSSSSAGVPCDMCGRYFASRNLVFKHLRDTGSGCGTVIFASGLLRSSLSKSHNGNSPHLHLARRLDMLPHRKLCGSEIYRSGGRVLLVNTSDCGLSFLLTCHKLFSNHGLR